MRILVLFVLLTSTALADECRPPLLCPAPEPKPVPVVVRTTEPCTTAGVCCRWAGFFPRLKCGWHRDCPGRREITFIDGKRMQEGECR